VNKSVVNKMDFNTYISNTYIFQVRKSVTVKSKDGQRINIGLNFGFANTGYRVLQT